MGLKRVSDDYKRTYHLTIRYNDKIEVISGKGDYKENAKFKKLPKEVKKSLVNWLLLYPIDYTSVILEIDLNNIKIDDKKSKIKDLSNLSDGFQEK